MPAADRTALEHFTRTGSRSVRAVERAHLLLRLADGRSGPAVAAERGVSAPTVYRVRHRYLAEGRAAALAERPRSGGPPRFGGAVRAQLTALACPQAPVGHGRWTLRLLADRAVALCRVDSIWHEPVSQVLKKTNGSPSASSRGAWAK